jgi:hypothetical protein
MSSDARNARFTRFMRNLHIPILPPAASHDLSDDAIPSSKRPRSQSPLDHVFVTHSVIHAIDHRFYP